MKGRQKIQRKYKTVLKAEKININKIEKNLKKNLKFVRKSFFFYNGK